MAQRSGSGDAATAMRRGDSDAAAAAWQQRRAAAAAWQTGPPAGTRRRRRIGRARRAMRSDPAVGADGRVVPHPFRPAPRGGCAPAVRMSCGGAPRRCGPHGEGRRPAAGRTAGPAAARRRPVGSGSVWAARFDTGEHRYGVAHLSREGRSSLASTSSLAARRWLAPRDGARTGPPGSPWFTNPPGAARAGRRGTGTRPCPGRGCPRSSAGRRPPARGRAAAGSPGCAGGR